MGRKGAVEGIDDDPSREMGGRDQPESQADVNEKSRK